MPSRTAAARACPRDKPLPTHASTTDPQTLTGRSDSVSFSLVHCTHKVLLMSSKSFCFPLSCGSSVIKSHCPSKSDFLGILSFFAGFPSWEIRCGGYNLHNSVRTSLILLFLRLLVTHLANIGFDFIVFAFLLPSDCGFLFNFGYGISLCVCGFQHSPVNVC